MQNNIRSYLALIPSGNNNKENPTSDAQGGGEHTVWINEKERVAAFRAITGYTAQAFTTHECFMNYLLSLQGQGFRFW